jgi:hypothetical protein
MAQNFKTIWTRQLSLAEGVQLAFALKVFLVQALGRLE